MTCGIPEPRASGVHHFVNAASPKTPSGVIRNGSHGMDADARPHAALHAAIVKLLRPLFRVLLRHQVSFGAFEELAKRAYVDVALNDFGIPGKKPSLSRASILSGLTRKEVQRLVGTAPDGDTAVGERYNRAARVLTGWLRDDDPTHYASLEDAEGAARQPAPIGAPSSGPYRNVRLTVAEIDLMIDALARASSRLESIARTLKFGRKHDEAAARMRALRFRLAQERQ